MKRLLVLGTIAALALSTTAEAKGHKGKKAARQMVARQQVYNTGTTRFAPARTRTVVRGYSNGGSYYGRGYYGGRRTIRTTAVVRRSRSALGPATTGILGIATAIRITTTATVAIHTATTATDLAIMPAVIMSSSKSSSVLRVPGTTTA